MATSSLRAEQVEATRRALLEAARKLFAADGYGKVSTEQIVREARVTRGALYHHFEDKRDLFAAVVAQIGEEMYARIEQAALSAPTSWDGVLAGMNAFLDGCLERDIYRIVVLDGPSVLGPEVLHQKGNVDARGLLAAGLGQVMDDGVIERQPVETLAHLIVGAMIEAARLIAAADDHEATRAEVGATLQHLVKGLRIPKD